MCRWICCRYQPTLLISRFKKKVCLLSPSLNHFLDFIFPPRCNSVFSDVTQLCCQLFTHVSVFHTDPHFKRGVLEREHCEPNKDKELNNRGDVPRPVQPFLPLTPSLGIITETLYHNRVFRLCYWFPFLVANFDLGIKKTIAQETRNIFVGEWIWLCGSQGF